MGELDFLDDEFKAEPKRAIYPPPPDRDYLPRSKPGGFSVLEYAIGGFVGFISGVVISFLTLTLGTFTLVEIFGMEAGAVFAQLIFISAPFACPLFVILAMNKIGRRRF